jgi:L-amino acid N-acyltransferase YncA
VPTLPQITLRLALPDDAPTLVEIYRPYVEDSAVSFEFTTPSITEFRARITKIQSNWEWLLAECNGRCVGYAYATAHRERAAYRWSVEVSAYVHVELHRRGIGRALYEQLFDDITAKGYCNAYAGIALPNPASIALHRRLGFETVGVFKSVGRKFGRWHDVLWMHRTLRQAPPED